MISALSGVNSVACGVLSNKWWFIILKNSAVQRGFSSSPFMEED